MVWKFLKKILNPPEPEYRRKSREAIAKLRAKLSPLMFIESKEERIKLEAFLDAHESRELISKKHRA